MEMFDNVDRIRDDLKKIDVSKLPPVGQMNYQKVSNGLGVLEKFQTMARDPMRYNTELLMRILDKNKDTEYGRKYGFADIHSIEEYRKRVPVTVYDDYAEYILRQTEDGEEGLLCASPVGHYNKSSGTMGNPKRLPMSDDAIEVFNRYSGDYLSALYAQMFGLYWLDGRQFSTLEAKDHVDYLKNGASFGALSVKALLGHRQYLPLMYTSPDEAIFPKAGTNTRYLHARFALMDADATMATGTFASIFLEMLKYIEQKWELLVKDIREGTIDESVKMDEEVRESLLKKIQPMPERADALEAIFRRGFDEPFAPKAWPKLRFSTLVATGGFKVYGDKIRERYFGETIPFCKNGLNASEGIFSVPFAPDSEDTALIPDSVFYEFLPLDAEDDFSKIVGLDGVEVGRDYELIVTNLSGFYRYRMRDAVRISGRFGSVPTIQFLYRIDQTVSLMGEKTTEVALRSAAENTAKELDFEMVDFCMYPDADFTPPRYLYFMELGRMPEGLRAKEIRFELEHQLAIANPSMGAKVQSGLCSPTKLNILEPQTFLLYHDLMVARGTAASQVKPVRIVSNEVQRKFFFGLTEYGVELVK